MFKDFVNKYFLILIIIILGSGGVIYVFHLFKGENLAEPPVFDLSAYEELDWPDFDEVFPSNETTELANFPEQSLDMLKEVVDDEIEHKTEMELLPQKIYISSSFKQDIPVETSKMVADFIADFPSLVQLEFTDIVSFRCSFMELPAEQREALKKDLMENEFVESVNAKEVPEYEVCFNDEIYYPQYEEFLLQYPVVVNKTLESKDSGYVGYFDYSEAEIEFITEDLEKLKAEYSDVVKIVK